MRKMFSENQIKGLAVQGVNEGIEQGQVQVGTKLYVHNVVINETEFIIISNSPNSYEGQFFADIWNDVLDMRYASGDYEKILTFNHNDTLYCISTEGSIASIDVDTSPTIASDEVIPL